VRTDPVLRAFLFGTWYGLHYAGPFDSPGAAKQHSAFETFTAAIR
ncbi:unnamed protein product, partial [Allacma fusca]